MAEAPENNPIPSSSENVVSDEVKEEEPLAKKRKVDKEPNEKLEHRLGGILCCAVCFDLPQAAVYQCSNGHLMCATCFTHLLADARLRDEAATCPNCRIEISKSSASRNLAVEKTVSELPAECKFCTQVFPRHSLQQHEQKSCDNREYKFAQVVVEAAPRRWLGSLVRIAAGVCAYACALRPAAPRPAGCRYACIGCGWRGPAHEAGAHEAQCACPRRSASELVRVLALRDEAASSAHAVYDQLLDLLSYEKISFNDLQLKPYRTEEYMHKLYYETSRFSAFGHQWVVKAFVNKNQRDPTQSSQREITYQVILKSKTSCPVALQWSCLRGPFGDAALRPRLVAHAFCDDAPDAPPLPLPLADPADANRLLANKAIHFRCHTPAFCDDAPDAPPLPLPLADPADANRLLANKAIHFRCHTPAFCDDAPDAPPLPLPLADPADANRLLANKAIHFRCHTPAFCDDAPDAPPLPLPLADPADANRLLANKAIHFRCHTPAFCDDAPDAPPLPLPLADPADANRLLANKAIHFRCHTPAFCDDAPDAPPLPLPLADPADANRLLANKAIHFRCHTPAFCDDAPDAPPLPLPLADPADANRLLANKAIHFRCHTPASAA